MGKNQDTLTCIDLISTNSHKQFQAMLTLETGLSDFHKMTVAAFVWFRILASETKLISYWNYKHFNRNDFEEKIKNTLAYYMEDLAQRFFGF